LVHQFHFETSAARVELVTDDELGSSGRGTCHSFHEGAGNLISDSDGEHAGVVGVLAAGFDNLLGVGNFSVGQNENLTSASATSHLPLENFVQRT
jgi:hypothetical protein